MMTKKDYKKFAEMIKWDMTHLDQITLSAESLNQFSNPQKALTDQTKKNLVAITIRIADILASDNPRFDRDRFYKACGLQN